MGERGVSCISTELGVKTHSHTHRIYDLEKKKESWKQQRKATGSINGFRLLTGPVVFVEGEAIKDVCVCAGSDRLPLDRMQWIFF